MATLTIFDKAESIRWSHSLSLVQTKSDGGIRKAQRRGPYLYNFTVLPSLMYDNSDEYYAISSEVSNSFGYGVSAVITQLPISQVYNRGTWAGSPLVDGASQVGSSVNLKGFTINTNNIVRGDDWVQFAGDTKVYQVLENASSDGSGKLTLKLNTPLIATAADAAVVTHGNSVQFKLALINPGSVDPIKRPYSSTANFASWGRFIFEEVL